MQTPIGMSYGIIFGHMVFYLFSPGMMSFNPVLVSNRACFQFKDL